MPSSPDLKIDEIEGCSYIEYDSTNERKSTKKEINEKKELMKRKFELVYSYKHCYKENRYVFGFAYTEEEARQWVDDYTSGKKKMPRPEDEESRLCPASYCPLKGQKAWFSYREVAEDDT